MADEIRSCSDLDERLAPYADGEDAAPSRRAVDAHLAACPECREEARTEAVAREIIHEHRAALSAHAPESLRARCVQAAADAQPSVDRSPQSPAGARSAALRPRPSLLRKWAPLSLAATLVLAVAGVFVFGLNNRVEALATSLAVDHVKCFKVNGTATRADAAASERVWQQDQGWPIAVPHTETAEQLTLLDVRRCFSTDGRAAHMMYTWRGEPLSVYVLQGDAGRDRTVHKMGAQAVIWCANQRTYAVVSSDASRDLTPIVDYIKTRVK
jgi:anti-sigma factor RsiW